MIFNLRLSKSLDFGYLIRKRKTRNWAIRKKLSGILQRWEFEEEYVLEVD